MDAAAGDDEVDSDVDDSDVDVGTDRCKWKKTIQEEEKGMQEMCRMGKVTQF